MDFPKIIDLLSGDPSVCYFFLMPKKISKLEKTRKRIKKLIKLFSSKYIEFDPKTFRKLSGENNRYPSPTFDKNFIYSKENNTPLTFIFINHLEGFSFENQHTFKHYLDNGWDNLRYIFTGRKLEKISPVILSRCLTLKIGENFKKNDFFKNNKLTNFFLEQPDILTKELIKKNFWNFLEKKLILGPGFYQQIVNNLGKTHKLPNEIFFFYLAQHKKSKLNVQSHQNDIYFSQKFRDCFFLQMLEYHLLVRKQFKVEFNVLFQNPIMA